MDDEPKRDVEAEVEAAGEMIGFLEAAIDTVRRQADQSCTARARQTLFHLDQLLKLYKGEEDELIAMTLIEFCYRWRPLVLEACGGNEQQAVLYIAQATELAVRLGFTLDDLTTEMIGNGNTCD